MNPNSTGSPEAKKTRRRLRLSCVECTKRRQKCDRAHPCGLCKSRGVPDRCRWSQVPFSRPTPARPPAQGETMMSEPSEDKVMIQQLSDRICFLEKQLEQFSTNGGCCTDSDQFASTSAGLLFSSNLSSGSGSIFHSAIPSPEPAYRESDVDQTVLLAERLGVNSNLLESIAPSLVHIVGCHEDHLGPGSSLHTFQHMVRSYAPEAHAGLQSRSLSCFNIFMKLDFGRPNITCLGSLMEKIPLQSDVERLMNAYFLYTNWSFGFSETWIRAAISQMYQFIHFPGSLPGVSLNPNWLCLFFALLASVCPNAVAAADHAHDTEEYLTCSFTALRVVDDIEEPSCEPSLKLEGSLLACLAIPLLSKRLAAIGRLGEAWRILGKGVRLAQSLGLNCDPAILQWTDDEKYLGRLAWINLGIWDRFYSLLLSRPSMGLPVLNVVPQFTSSSAEGSIPAYVSALHRLSFLAECINDLYIRHDSCQAQTIARLVSRLHEWKRTSDFGSTVGTDHVGPVRSLSSWCLFLQMRLHAKSVDSDSQASSRSTLRIGSRKTLMDLCVQLIKTQCAAHDLAVCLTPEADSRNTLICSSSFDSGAESPLMLLEACVALLLHTDRQHHPADGVIDVLHTVCDIFRELYQEQGAPVRNISYIGQAIIHAFLQSWHLGPDTKPARVEASSSSESIHSPSTKYTPEITGAVPYTGNFRSGNMSPMLFDPRPTTEADKSAYLGRDGSDELFQMWQDVGSNGRECLSTLHTIPMHQT